MITGRVQAARVGVFSDSTGPASRSCMRCGARKQITKHTNLQKSFICRDCRINDPEYVRMVSG